VVLQKAVLVVDDNPDVHQLLAAMLSKTDCRVDCVSDAYQALERLERFPYDLILTDVNMPGMDGLALLRLIRESRPDIKVVVMTGGSTPAHVIESIRQQAFSYFSKPFSAAAVVDMVNRALDSPSWKDDIEVLSGKPDWIALRLRCKAETGDRILQFLKEMGMDLAPEEQDVIATAFRELLMNAIEHGGQSDPNQKVTVSYVRTSKALIYYVRDPGEGFSFENLPHAAISNPPDSPTDHAEVRDQMGIRPGGFGILLTRNLVDDLVYNEKGNEVMLIKYLKNGNGAPKKD
jgi:CheY-like chemotaxis protein/anti-sigma regulatory factor (Ser/Thr protein kinase)